MIEVVDGEQRFVKGPVQDALRPGLITFASPTGSSDSMAFVHDIS
jgi:hypothetical protein